MKNNLANYNNIRRAKFARLYANLGNATEAAKQAGYSDRTARSQGQRLLTNDAIRDEIAQEKARINASVSWTKEESLKESIAQYHRLSDDKPDSAFKYKENADRLCGHLVDKVDQTTHNQALTDLSTVNESALVAELAKRMQLSSQGIRTSGAEVAQSETCGVETEIGKSAVSH